MKWSLVVEVLEKSSGEKSGMVEPEEEVALMATPKSLEPELLVETMYVEPEEIALKPSTPL